MEAVALFDFSATAADELSLSRGDTINLIDVDSDKNWYRAERVDGNNSPLVGYIPTAYVKWTCPQWFHGRMRWRRAEKLLMLVSVDEGTFSVRLGNGEGGMAGCCISVKQRDQASGELHVGHYKVLRDDNGMYFLWKHKFKSLDALVKHHATTSVSRLGGVFLLRALGEETAIMPWSIKTHNSMPKTVKTTVLTILLIQHRMQCWVHQQSRQALRPSSAAPSTNAVSMSVSAAIAAATLHSCYAAITKSFPSTISIFAYPPMSTENISSNVVPPHVDDISAQKFGKLAALLSTVPCEMVLMIFGFLTMSVTQNMYKGRPCAFPGDTVVAKWNFEAQCADELGFKRGDLIKVKSAKDEDWWKGTFEGNVGWIPAPFVKVLDE